MWYQKLVNKKLSNQRKEYRIVNDAFIFAIIRFIKGDYAKRMSIDTIEKIADMGAYYIQFTTFTYVGVASRTMHQKKLLR